MALGSNLPLLIALAYCSRTKGLYFLRTKGFVWVSLQLNWEWNTYILIAAYIVLTLILCFYNIAQTNALTSYEN